MKVIGKQVSPELVNLQLIGQENLGQTIPLIQTECADDAPC